MEEQTVRCPKCGHGQHGGTECQACGLIFARYEQVQKRRQQQLDRAAEEKQRARRPALLWPALLLVVVTAAITAYIMRPAPDAPVAKSRVATPPPVAAPLPGEPMALPATAVAKPVVRPPVEGRTAGRIELAREATVSIVTPWGSGSGFFISKNYIVTNRHVVRIDPNQLAEFRHKVVDARRLIELEKTKIRNLRERLRRTPEGPTRKQLRIIIDEHQRQLDKVLPGYERAETQLATMQQPVGAEDIKVILADGSTLTPDDLQVSENHDLAILSLFVANPRILHRPPKGFPPLRQGERVYTVGSPEGLRNTVTSGVFSGYQKRISSGEVYLQTDAAINPGNSGGPLIDEHGYVRGVNTMILKNTEGIGFAIPIDEVFDDFGSAIY